MAADTGLLTIYTYYLFIKCFASICVTDISLAWFTLYLFDYLSCSKKKNNNNCFQPLPVSYGVPQIFVLGPLLFLIYLLPLATLENSVYIFIGMQMIHNFTSPQSMNYDSFLPSCLINEINTFPTTLTVSAVHVTFSSITLLVSSNFLPLKVLPLTHLHV